MELPRRERADYSVSVILKHDGQIVDTSKSANISLNGIFIEAKEILPLESDCLLELTLGDPKTGIKLVIKTKVVRISDDGMGLAFESMDIDTFGHLKNIVLYNADNPRTVVDQFLKKPGFK